MFRCGGYYRRGFWDKPVNERICKICNMSETEGEFSILSKWRLQTFIFSFEDLLFYSFRRIIVAHAWKFSFKVLCLGHIFSRWWSEQIFLVTSSKEIWSPEADIGRRGAVTLIFSTPSKVWLNYKPMNRRSIIEPCATVWFFYVNKFTCAEYSPVTMWALLQFVDETSLQHGVWSTLTQRTQNSTLTL